ncbi:MAG: amidohydrolase family protein, partial [Methanospirillum sp.]|nr:amidohydrolase family protein [Methanospirillum sp.]
MTDEYSVSGTALTGDFLEAQNVTITVKNGIITAVEEEKRSSPYWICPAFFNAHTHIADTVAMDISCRGTLEELVTPPFGLKHRILGQTPGPELIRAMRGTINEMITSGTAGFADFREGGVKGVAALKKAAEKLPIRPIILGRAGGESVSDGAGISSVRDTCYSSDIISRMKKDGKIVAFHAGEKDSGDIEDALDTEPDLLVHCTHATKRQIRMIADAGIPVTVCCRSNFLLEVTRGRRHPPIREMLEAEIPVLIGTDNAMFVQPDMWQEMAFIHTVYGISEKSILTSATSGFAPAGIEHTIMPGNIARFFVL